ncbi:MAG: RNB domain-containing ribonuclease, partial [Candidatus Thioglobus sp.]|nr:RNB domain-containing ribonuclease [Candidatus Thioglobus sp.]
MINSLIAFKGKPARIVSQNTHKFAIEFAGGELLNVREKDFRFIHPEFIQVSENCAAADTKILTDFQQQILSLQEITEWLFNEYSPQNAWCACLLVEDGLYFYWQKDKVFVRPAEQVKSIQNKRDAEALEAKNLQNCIKNINNNIVDKADLPYFKEIEKVALNQSKHAKILAAIGVENSPKTAYELLLKLQYLQPGFNPYPARHGILNDVKTAVSMAKVKRTDLTNLRSYAIDNADSNDADDAISIDVEADKLWVHIADVACVAAPDSELDLYALERASNLYLPDQILHMLPPQATKLCALGLSEISPALSIGFRLKGNEVKDIEIFHSNIKVTKMSYDEADNLLAENADLSALKTAAEKHQKYR